MNRVAIVTDLHANIPALEAMLTRTDELEAKAVYCGGDLVGYGPHPNDVCQLIEERAIATIYGNYDYAIARDLDDCGCFYPTPNDRETGQRSVAWTLEHSDERSKRFMHDLPFDLRFELAGKRIRLVHGSPRKVNEYLLEDRAASTFVRIAQLADCDILLFGHTHKPWVREYGGVLFVNCGSVGKPKDSDPRGSFAVLTESDGRISVSIERIEYDARAVAGEIRSVGLPHELAEQLLEGA
ncbi:MAG TPA: metallophosphoesterase family protein [Gaiellaceae bacterium]|nr:metallophosphoesterase family protein [Gaiellaceae bacterium]